MGFPRLSGNASGRWRRRTRPRSQAGHPGDGQRHDPSPQRRQQTRPRRRQTEPHRLGSCGRGSGGGGGPPPSHELTSSRSAAGERGRRRRERDGNVPETAVSTFVRSPPPAPLTTPGHRVLLRGRHEWKHRPSQAIRDVEAYVPPAVSFDDGRGARRDLRRERLQQGRDAEAAAQVGLQVGHGHHRARRAARPGGRRRRRLGDEGLGAWRRARPTTRTSSTR